MSVIDGDAPDRPGGRAAAESVPEMERLRAENRQQSAQLAVLYSVQQALAADLDMQGIYDAVGDKFREIFPECESLDIRMVDALTGRIEFPYVHEHGERVEVEPMPSGGIMMRILATASTLDISENFHEEALRRE